jgi:hypothetical protein
MRATKIHPIHWQFILLGDLMQLERPLFTLDPTAQYREMTLRLFGNGLVTRRMAAGSEFTANEVQRLSEGQFVTSIHQFRNGAVAVVPHEFDGAVLSKNFLLFRVDCNQVLAAYLVHYLSSPRVIQFLQENSTGSATPIFPKHLMMRLEIPVPPIDEQVRMVTHFGGLSQRMASLTQDVERMAKMIEDLRWATYESAFEAGLE